LHGLGLIITWLLYRFFDIYISQGSAAMRLNDSGIFNKERTDGRQQLFWCPCYFLHYVHHVARGCAKV